MDFMVVGGVHLDRAWIDLGAPFGAQLRTWSREILARVVDEAHRHKVGALIVVGGLFDRTTTLPATVDYAAKVLGSFRGPVLICPGPRDWVGGAGPYGFQEWPANVQIWTTAEFTPAAQVPSVWASAWTSPASSAPPIPDGTRPRTLVRPGLGESEVDRMACQQADRLVTSGGSAVGKVLTVPDLVHDPRGSGGGVLLVNGDNPTQAAQSVDMPGQPGRVVEIDVTRLASTEALSSAVETAFNGQGPLLVKLVGVLGAPVLLPGFGARELPSGIVLDFDGLRYDRAVPEPTDRSARAEFLRAMADDRHGELHRHQTTALGLAALDTPQGA